MKRREQRVGHMTASGDLRRQAGRPQQSDKALLILPAICAWLKCLLAHLACRSPPSSPSQSSEVLASSPRPRQEPLSRVHQRGFKAQANPADEYCQGLSQITWPSPGPRVHVPVLGSGAETSWGGPFLCKARLSSVFASIFSTFLLLLLHW